jgi:hypothetical protein
VAAVAKRLTKTRAVPWLLALAAGLGGCAAPGDGAIPPPPATPDQIAREATYLRSVFPGDDCIERLVDAAPNVADPQSLHVASIYSVAFPASPLQSDGLSYVLEVTEARRMAYLFVSGGFAGRFTVTGPIPLARCLQDAFKE